MGSNWKTAMNNHSLDLGDSKPLWKLWSRILVVHHVGGNSIHQVVNELTPGERRYMIEFIKGYGAPMKGLLRLWDLPTDEIDRGDDFWTKQVLPILERRQRRPRMDGAGKHTVDRFARVKRAVDVGILLHSSSLR